MNHSPLFNLSLSAPLQGSSCPRPAGGGLRGEWQTNQARGSLPASAVQTAGNRGT